MTSEPLVVHCCHCTWCQRETGSAFVINAMWETPRVELVAGSPIVVDTPSLSGKGQKISRCPDCHVALWSNYPGGGDKVRFVRAGTLADPTATPPEIHIFTSTKQPWVVIPPTMKQFAEYYDSAKEWTAEALARRKVAFSS